MAFLGPFLEQELREDVERLGLGRADDERRHRRLAPRGEAVADPLLRADERERVDELVRARPRSPRAAARRGRAPGSARPPPPSRSGGRARCRSSCPSRPCRRRRGRGSGFSASRSASTSSPTSTLTVAAISKPSGAPAMLGAERVVEALGVDEDRQPAVGDLRGERDVLRADRGEVDRDVGAQRPHHHLQRLAEARWRPARRTGCGSARPRARRPRAGARCARSRCTRASSRAACPTAGRASPRRPAAPRCRDRG